MKTYFSRLALAMAVFCAPWAGLQAEEGLKLGSVNALRVLE